MMPIYYAKCAIMVIGTTSPTWGPSVTSTQTSIKAEALKADPRSTVFFVRANWMRLMGFSEDEVGAACIDDGSPIDLNDELENLRCARQLKDITPPRSVLESWAVVR
jgi:hypothetical protein